MVNNANGFGVAAAPARSSVFRRYSLSTQLVVTALGTLTVAFLTFLSTRIYAERFGAEQVSSVLIFRLCSSFVMAIASLGMPIAIQRTVALSHEDEREAASAAMAGLIVGTSSLVVLCALSAKLAPWIARTTQHGDSRDLWMAFSALTCVQGVATMLSLVELARGHVYVSSAINVSAYGIALIAAPVSFSNRSLPFLMWVTVSFALLTCIAASMRLCVWVLRSGKVSVRPQLARLLRYGVPRVPANLLDPSSDLVLPWLGVHSGGLREGGRFAAGLSLLRPLSPLVGSLNLILIPDEARLTAIGAKQEQKNRALILTDTALHLGAFGAVMLALWCDVLLKLWLGNEFVSAAPVARVLSFAILPAMIYGTTRGLIDGQNEKAVNSGNLTISFGVLIAGAAIVNAMKWGTLALAAAYVLSRLTLACLSIRHLFVAHEVQLRSLNPIRLLCSLACAAGVSLGARLLAGQRAIAMIAGVTLSTCVFFAAERMFRVHWTIMAGKRIRLHR